MSPKIVPFQIYLMKIYRCHRFKSVFSFNWHSLELALKRFSAWLKMPLRKTLLTSVFWRGHPSVYHLHNIWTNAILRYIKLRGWHVCRYEQILTKLCILNWSLFDFYRRKGLINSWTKLTWSRQTCYPPIFIKSRLSLKPSVCYFNIFFGRTAMKW